MNIEEIIQPFKTFYANNTELSIAVIVVLVIAAVIKPKDIGKILLVIGIIAIIGYFIASLSDIVSIGVDRKSEAGEKTDNVYRHSEQ